jgi:hypothetical protein
MDKFTQAQATNVATLAKPYTPTVVAQPYNNVEGYKNVFNPVTTPVNYDTTPELSAAQKAAADKLAADKAAADKLAADKLAADKAAADAAAKGVTTVQPPVTTGYTGRPITDQEVTNYLISNPNATDRDLVKIMDQYNVRPEQVARATGMQGVDPTSVQNIDRRYNMAKLANEGTNAFAVARQNQADAVTGQSIRDYFAKNPGMTDKQIANYMDQNSIDPAQMQYAFAGTPGAIGSGDVLARYQAATKLPAMVAGSPEEQAAIAGGQASLARINKINAEKQSAAAGGGQTFIPDPRLPEGMMGTMGGSGYDPVTGRVDLGTAGGSGQYVNSAETPKKLFNMGGIASLGSGGYPRRTGQISGPGTATSDSIPAMLSDGEFVMTAKAVRGAGKGDRRAGAKRMYALMNQLEKNAARG